MTLTLFSPTLEINLIMSENVSEYQSLVNSLTPYEQSILFTSSVVRGVSVNGQIRHLLESALAQIPSTKGSEFSYYCELLKLPSTRDLLMYCHQNYRQAFHRVTEHRLQNVKYDLEYFSFKMPDS